MTNARIVTLLILIPLAACSGGTVKSTLGLDRNAPDEFRVVSRPPLSVPPQFTLRPPAASEEAANQLSTSQQAESIVTGKNAPVNNNTRALRPGTADTAVIPVTVENSGSKAESAFLKSAGADKADPNVRQDLVEEKIAVQEKKESGSWWDVFPADSEKDPLVNAKGESERIRKNEDEGKPVTEGTTPESKAGDTGVLGRIFGF